jgi:LPXTG-motif cell wall-anchored protein
MTKLIMKKGIMLITLTTILLIHLAAAHIGMRPAIIEVDYEAGKEFAIEYTVDTTPDKKLNFSAEGDFYQYVTLSKTKMQGSGVFEARIKLPPTAEKPGTNLLYIFAKQEVDPKAGFGTAISVGALIKIYVPYPGMYAESTLQIENVNKGQEAKARLHITNRGKETINMIPEIKIYSGEETITTKKMSQELIVLAPAESTDLETIIDTTNYIPGNYQAEVTTIYGGEKPTVARANFRVGELNIEIINYTKKIITEKINPFKITIQNDWKDRIDGVYANISMMGEGGQLSFLTPPVNIEGFQTYELSGFADASTLKKGEYQTNISIHYSSKTSSIQGVILVVGETNMTLILVIAALVLISAGAGFYYKRKNEKKR